ncbi:MAG TPA: hypothetical protein VGM08_02940 [Candidatus Saccharimonadales bacterium]
MTKFAALADSMQTGKNTTKGVGNRGYNTAEAAFGASDVTDRSRYVGGYILEIASNRVLDWREQQGGLIRQIGHQVVQRATGRFKGPEYVADTARAQYGRSAGVAVINRPVNNTFDQYVQRLPDPAGIDPVITILLDPGLRPERVAYTYDYDPNNR